MRNPTAPREQPGDNAGGKNGLDKLADGVRKFEQASRALQDLARGRVGGPLRTAADLMRPNVAPAGVGTPPITPPAPPNAFRPPPITPQPVASLAGAPPIGSLPVGTPVAPGGVAAAGGQAAVGGGAAAGGLSAGAMVAVGAFAVVAAGAIALGGAFVMANKKAKEFTEQLAGYSGVIAASKAQADIRKLRQDIENARTVGSAVATRNNSESRAEAAASKAGATIERRLLEMSQPLYDLKVWIVEKGADLVQSIDEGITYLGKLAEELPFIGEEIKKAHEEDKAAAEKNAALVGSLDVLFQDIPDLDINDDATPAAKVERQDVGFAGPGAAQRDL